MLKALILFTEIFLLCGCSASSRPAPETLTGRWEGLVQTSDTKTKAIVDFTPDANGSLNASISVPDERLLGKPLINVRYQPPQLHFELQASERKIIFDGSRSDEVISGTVRGGEIQRSSVAAAHRRHSSHPLRAGRGALPQRRCRAGRHFVHSTNNRASSGSSSDSWIEYAQSQRFPLLR